MIGKDAEGSRSEEASTKQKGIVRKTLKEMLAERPDLYNCEIEVIEQTYSRVVLAFSAHKDQRRQAENRKKQWGGSWKTLTSTR